jgi:osmotically-inducible protein OsmY
MFKHNYIVSTLLVLFVSAFSSLVSANQTSVTPIKNDVVATTPVEEAKVKHTITNLINKSKALSKLKIQVAVNNGVVTLEGAVDSDSQVVSLIELAESVIGVSDVDVSKLTVKDGNQPIADAITTAKIKGLLIREKLFGEKDVSALHTSVETKDGVVYLIGVIDNKGQIDNAIEIIKKHVPEVKKVEYNVKQITPAN